MLVFAMIGCFTKVDLPTERDGFRCSGRVYVANEELRDEVYQAVGSFVTQAGLEAAWDGPGIEFRLDPDGLSDGQIGLTRIFRTSYGYRCLVILRSDGDLDTVMHEYGHVLGYGHSNTGLMRP